MLQATPKKQLLDFRFPITLFAENPLVEIKIRNLNPETRHLTVLPAHCSLFSNSTLLDFILTKFTLKLCCWTA